MGWYIYIVDENGETKQSTSPHFVRGSTYCIGGMTELRISTTYNYGSLFREYLGFPIGDFDGQQVRETITAISHAIAALKDDQEENYWKATEGNARRALLSMIELAAMAGYEGFWKIR